MNKKIKLAFKKSFTPPPTLRKEMFVCGLAFPKAKVGEVILAQIGFIRKRVWVSFIFMVVVAFLYTSTVETAENIVAGVSAMLPLLSLCTVSEIHKSISYKMQEMELACKHNLSQITLMRIGILGTASFVALMFCVALIGENNFGAFRNAIYICVPYLLSSYLSLLVVVKLQSKETSYICCGVCTFVSILMISGNSIYKFIYTPDFTGIWTIIFVTLVGLIFHTLAKFIKLQEEVRWNLL